MEKNILVLDDDPQILSLIKRTLCKQGFSVVTYSDPDDALEYFRRSNIEYDLIITDIEMPKMNGFDFVGKVKNIDPDIKTLGMSGSKTINLQKEKFSNFIEKPFGIIELRKAVESTLL